MMMKGFGSVLVIVIMATVLVFGGWYWSQNRVPATTTGESTSTPATGGETTSAGETPASTAVSPTTVTPSGNANVDSVVTSITASVDAYSNQANSEDGTEGAGELTTSLNNQPAYVQ